MNWTMAGALWALLGVGLGAFGAHGLKTMASEQALAWWETAARYQLVHALALVLLGLLQQHRPGGDAAGWSFLARKRPLQRNALRHGARRAALARGDHPDRRARE